MIASSVLTIFAAASLTNVFPAIDKKPTYSFAGSNALAAQIQQGAPADVFASANTSIPQKLYDAGLVEKPIVFTRNELILIIPKSNPAHIHSVYDLRKSGIKLDVAAPGVPVGDYTRTVLHNLGLDDALQNVVSRTRRTFERFSPRSRSERPTRASSTRPTREPCVARSPRSGSAGARSRSSSTQSRS